MLVTIWSKKTAVFVYGMNFVVPFQNIATLQWRPAVAAMFQDQYHFEGLGNSNISFIAVILNLILLRLLLPDNVLRPSGPKL